MKPSDLVTSSSERQQEMQGLLRTEMTDAVNSGLVDSSDKSARALKGAEAAKHVAKSGASSAAFATAAKERNDDGIIQSDAHGVVFEDDVVSSSSALTRPSLRRFGRSASRGSAPDYSASALDASDLSAAAGARLSAGTRRRHRLRDAMAYEGTHKVLEDTELEGADDLYYKTEVAKKASHRLSYAVNRRGRKVVESVESAREELFKKTRRNRSQEQAATAVQSRAQAASYGKKSVYTTAEKAREAAEAKKAATTIAGTASSGSAAPIALGPILLILLLALLFFIIIAGAAGQKSQQVGNGTLNETESQVAMFLMDKGLDELHTAAIMGNMYAESGINPSSMESGGTGIGICQWSYGRANNLRRYAAQQGKSWDDLNVQLDFFWDHDIWSSEWSSVYTIRTHQVDGDPAVGERVSGSKSGFLATSDLNDAVKQFCYGWERPGIPRINVRLEAAQRYYAALTTGGLIGGGEDYNSAEDWQKRIVDACGTTPWPGKSLCATWVSRVYANAGFPNIHGNGNSILSNSSSTSSDWSNIKVGQILSAQASPTPAGRIYGHTAIYIGGGQVMESVDSGVRTKSLSDWVAYYQQYGWVKYGWPW